MNNYIHFETLAALANKYDLRVSMSRVDTSSRYDAVSDIRAAVEADGRRYYINFPDHTSEMVVKTELTWEETFAAYAEKADLIQKELEDFLFENEGSI